MRQGLLGRSAASWLLLASLPLAQSLARKADKAALIHLFKLLGGPHWTKNDGWDADGGTDPCDVRHRWFGVGCIDPCDIYRDGDSCAYGRITALSLRDNNMTGSITNWTGIGDLHNLSWIDFSVNSISGSLPAEIGNIQNIEVLNMAWNQLDGGLPTTLGAINANGYGQLNELSMEMNMMQGARCCRGLALPPYLAALPCRLALPPCLAALPCRLTCRGGHLGCRGHLPS